MYSVTMWGFMIADNARMDVYSEALRRAVKSDSVVLDIGAGTGVFALLACRFGARRVLSDLRGRLPFSGHGISSIADTRSRLLKSGRTLIAAQRQPAPDARLMLIYGAGADGEILVRELLNNPIYHYRPVGFIDDDIHKAGKLLRGYQIISSDNLPELINSHGVSEVLISSLKAPESKTTSCAIWVWD